MAWLTGSNGLEPFPTVFTHLSKKVIDNIWTFQIKSEYYKEFALFINCWWNFFWEKKFINLVFQNEQKYFKKNFRWESKIIFSISKLVHICYTFTCPCIVLATFKCYRFLKIGGKICLCRLYIVDFYKWSNAKNYVILMFIALCIRCIHLFNITM